MSRSQSHVAASVVFGPVQSRRFGTSLGIALSAPDVRDCSWSCPYCQCQHLPHQYQPLPATEIIAEVMSFLRESGRNRQAITTITVAGNAEPSGHPEFATIVRALRTALDVYLPAAQFILLTNGDGFVPGLLPDSSARLVTENQLCLSYFDAWYLKWDIGPRLGAWRSFTPGQVAQRRASWRHLRQLRLQSMVYCSEPGQAASGSNTEDAWHRWSQEVGVLRPRSIDIITIARPAGSGLLPVPMENLHRRVGRLRELLPRVAIRLVGSDENS